MDDVFHDVSVCAGGHAFEEISTNEIAAIAKRLEDCVGPGLRDHRGLVEQRSPQFWGTGQDRGKHAACTPCNIDDVREAGKIVSRHHGRSFT